MRLAIDGDGLAASVDTCRNANQITAILAETLASRLAPLGGMAGDDATSIEFAEPYDRAAATALTTLADLADAFTGLGTLVAATARRHRQAEDAAHDFLPADSTVALYDHGHLDTDDYLDVSLPAPPSALGANRPGLSSEQQWILDHVEGFAWPDADTDRLRQAARAWRTAAAHSGDLLDQCDILASRLADQTSPEIPLALAAVDELRGHVADTTSALADLADSCDDYAQQVEAAHENLVALIREILAMVVEGIVIGIVVSAVTAGAGAGVATGATIARIAAQSPRFRQIITTLRALAQYAGTRARRADEALDALRPRLARFKAARVRDERGSIRIPALLGPRGLPPGFLQVFEDLGGHTLRKHVGKSAEELLDQLLREGKSTASSFRNLDEAEAIIRRVLSRREKDVQDWLASDGGARLRLSETLGDTGISVGRDGRSTSVDSVRVVLVKSDHGSPGWRVLTSFPEP